MGQYHTIDLELNRKFVLTKNEWDIVSMERVGMTYFNCFLKLLNPFYELFVNLLTVNDGYTCTAKLTNLVTDEITHTFLIFTCGHFLRKCLGTV